MKTLEEIKKSGAPVCAFTFDDGPSDTTVRLLDIFKKYDCRASFFVVSAWGGEEGVSIMRRAVEQGCTIENHSKTHRDMRTMERSEIIAEYEATQKYVYDAVGDYPKFFRAPGLCVNDTVYDSVPLTFINGQCGSADWNSREDDPKTSDYATRLAGVLSCASDGHIFLMHDCRGNHLTPDVLEEAIPLLKAKGYEFVNIRELFEIKGQPLTPELHKSWTDIIS